MSVYKHTVEKTIYFVRHGRSVGNDEQAFQGLDSPLSKEGKAQANLVAGRLAKIPFDTLISSPLLRARDTAQIIAEASGKTPEYSKLFVERFKPSRVSDRPHTDKEAHALWEEWEKSLYTSGLRVEDGENFDDQIARADAALEFLRARPEKSIVVVSHGYFLRTIVARVLLGETLTQENFQAFQSHITMDNTGITALRFEDAYKKAPAWHLWVHNDHSHCEKCAESR